MIYLTGPELLYIAARAIGIAEVTREAFPDPTAKEGDWSAVELKPVKPLKKPVTLAEIKADPFFKTFALVRISRLSVMPVTDAEWNRIEGMAGR